MMILFWEIIRAIAVVILCVDAFSGFIKGNDMMDMDFVHYNMIMIIWATVMLIEEKQKKNKK